MNNTTIKNILKNVIYAGIVLIIILVIGETVKANDLTLSSDKTLTKEESYDNIWTEEYNLYGDGFDLFINNTLNINASGSVDSIQYLGVNGTINSYGNISIGGFSEFNGTLRMRESGYFWSNDYNINFNGIYLYDSSNMSLNDSAYIFNDHYLNVLSGNSPYLIMNSGVYETDYRVYIYYLSANRFWHNNGIFNITGNTMQLNFHHFFNLIIHGTVTISVEPYAICDNDLIIYGRITSGNTGPFINVTNDIIVRNGGTLDQSRNNASKSSNVYLYCKNLYMDNGSKYLGIYGTGFFMPKENFIVNGSNCFIEIGNKAYLPDNTYINTELTLYNHTNSYIYLEGDITVYRIVDFKHSTINLRGNSLYILDTYVVNGNILMNNSNLIINGTLSSYNIDNTKWNSDNDTTIIINGFWDINSNLCNNNKFIYLDNLIINGEVNINNYSFQNYNNIKLSFNDNNLFRNSIGELNISVPISHFVDIEGNGVKTIDFNNMSDYFFYNVAFKNLNNIDSEYITVHGNNNGSLNGLWDFTPPIITHISFINSTTYYIDLTPMVNFSWYMEELSYLHNYTWEIVNKLSGDKKSSGSFNYTTPIYADYKYLNLNITTWDNGEYWFNISVSDTHNKVNKLSKNYNKLMDTKYKVNGLKVGKFDNHVLNEMSNIIYMENFKKNKDILSLEFINTKNEIQIIEWNDKKEQYKLTHIVELKDNFARLKISSSQVYYIAPTNTFVINGIYFYDVSDFLFQDNNNYITISHQMKNDKYSYYYIDFHNHNWESGMIINIDPLSGGVNTNETFDTFYIDSLPPPLADIISINQVGEDITFTAGYIYIWNNTIANLTLRSSIDGLFYNGSTNPETFNGFTGGIHTFYLAIQDINNTWSAEVSLVVLISNVSISSTPDENDNWYYNADSFINVSVITVFLIALIVFFIYIFYKSVIHILR